MCGDVTYEKNVIYAQSVIYDEVQSAAH